MGMRSVNVRVHHTTYETVHLFMPKDWTPSAWLREIVETLTDRPETNYRRRTLQNLIERSRLADEREELSGPCTLMFRCQAEHWDALQSLARAVGLSRTTYFRKAMCLGSMYKSQWYERYEKDEDTTTTKPERIRNFGPWPKPSYL